MTLIECYRRAETAYEKKYYKVGYINKSHICMLLIRNFQYEEYIEVVASSGDHCFIKKQDLPELNHTNNQILDVEPEALAEIADVTVKYGRLVLEIKDDAMIPASRKFGLSDKYKRYEFDGGSMFVYKPSSISADWSFGCGQGGYTLVSDNIKKYRDAVKKEMLRQAIEKKLMVKQEILFNLPTEKYGKNVREVMPWCF